MLSVLFLGQSQANEKQLSFFSICFNQALIQAIEHFDYIRYE